MRHKGGRGIIPALYALQVLMFVYMRMLLHLERKFAMPDVDFVINTIVRPLGLNLPPSSNDEPVFRFCKGDSHADVLIPIFHFHMKNFDEQVLGQVPLINKTYPCEAVQYRRGTLHVLLRCCDEHIHSNPSLPPNLNSGASKKDVVFGRFTPYGRHFHTLDPNMPPRLGAGGISICNASKLVTSCVVREHFIEWSLQVRGQP